MNTLRLSAALVFFVSSTGFAQGAALPLTQIGAAGAVAGRVTALAPQTGAAGRVLSSGKTVYFNDRIATDAAGRLQVLLLDETVFTIGPNAEMIIDEFVYDPFTQSGKVAARITKGVFRFVTGKVARKKPSAMKVTLPTGVIGIRGTIAGGRVSPDGSALIALLGPGAGNNADERPGAIEAENAGETVILSQPGFATVLSPGQPPTPPFRLSPEQLADLSTKPQAEAGAGDPEGSEGDAKETGGFGDTSTIAKVVGEDLDGQGEQNDLLGFAAQETQPDDGSIINWPEFRDAVPESGTANYQAIGSYSCVGGVCGGGGSGQWETHFQVDWAARTLGGGGSSSHIAFSAGSGGPLCVSGCSGEYDSQIPLINFSQLTGDAKLVQGQDYTGTNAEFNGSSFQFNNNPGTFTTELIYAGQGTSTNATATGTCNSGTCP